MSDTITKETGTEQASSTDGLKDAVRGLGRSALSYGLGKVGSVAENLTGKLTDYAEGRPKEQGETEGPLGGAVAGGVDAATSGENPAVGALKGAFSGAKDKIKEKLTGGGGKSPARKFSNIVDSFDVGVPVRVAYNQWTQFGQWSEFMKKLEFAEVEDGGEGGKGKVKFKAKIFVLHRRWESTIVEMVPDERVVWQSTGDKGYLNGAVTFAEVAPQLTRLCLAIDYHPQGFWEHTINIWRSVGSRIRLETKLYIHHVMNSTILDPEAAPGWRAEIHDSTIVRTHDEVVQQEQEQQDQEQDQQDQGDQQPQGEQDQHPQDENGRGADTDDESNGADDEQQDRRDDDGEDEYDDEEGEGYDDQAGSDEDEPADESDEGPYDDEDEGEYDDEDDGDYDDEGDEGEYDDEGQGPEDSEPRDRDTAERS